MFLKLSRDNIQNSTRVNCFLFCIFGCWLALAHQPFSLTYFSLLALPIMAFSWARLSWSPLKSGLLGGAFGVGYFSVTMFWITEPFLVGDVKYLPWLAPFALLLMSTYLSFFWAGAFYLASYFGGGVRVRKIFNLVCFFTLAEILRSTLFGGFPWGLISSSLIDTPFIQLISIIGPYGLVFMIYLLYFSVVISKFWSFCSLLLSLALYISSDWLYLENIVPNSDNPKLKLVQPNISQSEKWDQERSKEFYQRFIDLSRKKPKSDLIIFPETSVATDSSNMLNFAVKFANDLDNDVIIGVRRYEKNENKLYNSILFISKKGSIDYIYDKQHLVPFGEYIPIVNWFIPSTSKEIYGFSKGHNVAEISFLDFPTLLPVICYEIIFSLEVGQRFKNARWILNLTNDAWFGSFSGPQQHLVQARMRSIELGIPTIRVANTGISAVIDSNGSLISKLSLNDMGTLSAFLPTKVSGTAYTSFGPRNWLLLLIIINFLILLFMNVKKPHFFSN